MNTKKLIVYFTGAVLATESVLKHGECSPHTPHAEYLMHNSSMVVNVYGISNNQSINDTTLTGFATLVTI